MLRSFSPHTKTMATSASSAKQRICCLQNLRLGVPTRQLRQRSICPTPLGFPCSLPGRITRASYVCVVCVCSSASVSNHHRQIEKKLNCTWLSDIDLVQDDYILNTEKNIYFIFHFSTLDGWHFINLARLDYNTVFITLGGWHFINLAKIYFISEIMKL